MTADLFEPSMALLSGFVFPLCMELVIRVGVCRAYELVREETIPAILRGASVLFSIVALIDAGGIIWYREHSLPAWIYAAAYAASATVFFVRARILEVRKKAKAEPDGQRTTRGV